MHRKYIFYPYLYPLLVESWTIKTIHTDYLVNFWRAREWPTILTNMQKGLLYFPLTAQYRKSMLITAFTLPLFSTWYCELNSTLSPLGPVGTISNETVLQWSLRDGKVTMMAKTPTFWREFSPINTHQLLIIYKPFIIHCTTNDV